jgi:hypothetical protein
LGDLPGNNLHLAAFAIPDPATNADEIHAQLPGAVKKRLFFAELAATTNRFEVYIKQASIS